MTLVVFLFLCLIFVIILLSFTKTNELSNEIKGGNNQNIFNQVKMKDVFSTIYKYNKWGGGSGPGSFKECTVEYLAFLHKFVYSHDIRSIADLGCGDWQMLKHFNFTNNINYYGYDVVQDVIEADKRLYGKENINFYLLESVSKMRITDLLMVKDVLLHWNNEMIINFLKSVMIKYKYVILVQDFDDGKENKDIEVGQFRSINLELYPFNFTVYKQHIDMYFCRRLKRIYIKENEL